MTSNEKILIVDSGSTKTDWCIVDGTNEVKTVRTSGINPYMQSTDDIAKTIQNELIPVIGKIDVSAVRFYGAGCTSAKISFVEKALRDSLNCSDVEVCSDLLGAARALCGHNRGMVGILGTGSNSGFYDGHCICKNVPPLGYILGDEGSGAVLGRNFLGDLLKEQLPTDLYHDFMEEYKLTPSLIMDLVYRETFPNRFMAGLCPFIKKHEKRPCVRTFLIKNFQQFFHRNIASHRCPDVPVSLTGSVAFHFKDEVMEAAILEGFGIAKIVQSPLDGLINYHMNDLSVMR